MLFQDLRMELLEEPVNQYLIQALYGLLMIMPQSDAFQLLRHRLKCVPNFRFGSEKYVLYVNHIYYPFAFQYKVLFNNNDYL